MDKPWKFTHAKYYLKFVELTWQQQNYEISQIYIKFKQTIEKINLNSKVYEYIYTLIIPTIGNAKVLIVMTTIYTP